MYKKRKMLYVLLWVLVISLTACGRIKNDTDTETSSNNQTETSSNNQTETSSNNQTETSSNNQEESKQGLTTSNIAKALLEESKFWLVTDDAIIEIKQVTLNDIKIKEEYSNKTIKMLQVDLDDDGIDEVILQFQGSGDHIVFHDLDGEVYAYEVPFRGMIDITVDKLIRCSSSASIGSYYKVVGFTSTGIISEALFGVDETSSRESYYYKGDGEIISDEEFRELFETYYKYVGKLVFKDFRAENIIY